MSPQKIVITGGPGSGKTSLIEALEADGYECFHEIIRTFTQQAKSGQKTGSNKNNPIAFVDDSLEFNTKLIEGRLAQFLESDNSKQELVFFDRGMPDVLGYMKYFEQPLPEYFIELCKAHRYDQILILPPWEEIYNTDNERFENWDIAYEIYDFLKDTYTDLGYTVADVPIGTIPQRKAFIEQKLKLRS